MTSLTNMLIRMRLMVALLATVASSGFAQNTPDAQNPQAQENAEQVAKILGISQSVSTARLVRSQRPCQSAVAAGELSIRLEILETVVAASLQVDGVLAELENERAHLDELSSILQARRDQSVNLTNTANLVTGTGLGIAVNALQFSSSTANIGNGIGVGSGIASTLLSVVGIRLQHGPRHAIGRIPNMLAPLFGREPQLNSYYPQSVLDYLHSVPPGSTNHVSRLEQLAAEWRQTGRLGPTGSPKTDQQITRLTSSLEQKTKLSIDDISDRIAMLGDVSGRVALMKRDLADLMLSVNTTPRCEP